MPSPVGCPGYFWAFLPATRRGAVYRAALAGLLLAVATLAGHIRRPCSSCWRSAFTRLLYLWLGRTTVTRSLARAARSGGLLLVAVSARGRGRAGPAARAQLAGYTARAGWNYAETAGYSLSPAQWIGWLIPGFFGRGPQFHWGAWPRVESGYTGILTLVLAGAGVCCSAATDGPGRGPAWPASPSCLRLGIYTIPTAGSRCCPASASCAPRRASCCSTDFPRGGAGRLRAGAALQPARRSGAVAAGERLAAGSATRPRCPGPLPCRSPTPCCCSCRTAMRPSCCVSRSRCWPWSPSPCCCSQPGCGCRRSAAAGLPPVPWLPWPFSSSTWTSPAWALTRTSAP